MPEPFTVEHFKLYAQHAILDNGECFELESFQERIVADVFSDVRECWVIIPEGNGKTTLLSMIALYHGDYTESASVPIAASSREQAEIMYRQAEGIIQRSPELQQRFRAYEGYRRIKCHRTGGRIQIHAADERTGDGVIPTLAIVDELHRHRGLGLYGTWRGKLNKRDGQLLTISTAGEPGSDFETTRDRIRKESRITDDDGTWVRAEGPGLVMHEWMVRDRAKTEDLDAVSLANPLSSLSSDVLRAKRGSPTMTPEHWERFTCNIAARLEGQAISAKDWDALEVDELPECDWCVGGVDLGWKIDTTAVVVLGWASAEVRPVLACRVIHPPVSDTEIASAILELQQRFSVSEWVYDPNAGAQQLVQQLERGDHPLQNGERLDFAEHSQDNAPMSLAAARLDEAIRRGWLRHDGHAELRRHVLHAVRRDLGAEKWRYDRPKEAKGAARRRFPTDALTALAMAHSVAVQQQDASKEPLVAWA